MRRVILAIVGTAAGLVALLSFKSHTSTAAATLPAPVSNQASQATQVTQATASAATPSASRSARHTSSGSPSSGSPASSSPPSSATLTKTVTGNAVDTQYGPVQVQITVKNGKITAAQAVQYPQDSSRDQQINSYAIPMLNQEAVSASSAHIDAVSGASYTSYGYINSLQNAVDQAGI
jgi:uncharacterized protein with FMN-binding domain